MSSTTTYRCDICRTEYPAVIWQHGQTYPPQELNRHSHDIRLTGANGVVVSVCAVRFADGREIEHVCLACVVAAIRTGTADLKATMRAAR